MQVIETPIKDLIVIKPVVFSDNRGYFFESFHKKKLSFLPEFVQDNESLSQKGVLRGLHFQKPPFAQAKLVRVVKGAVLDVAVDIRKNSPTYGQHYALELNEDNKLMFFIPVGFAHGFLTLADNTIFQYKCSDYYCKEAEGCISWNDADIAIQWNCENPILSEKDKTGESFRDFVTPF